LSEHRGQGRHKLTVEYAQVAAGGQAVVGQVKTGKTVAARTAGAKSGTKAIPDNPAETVVHGKKRCRMHGGAKGSGAPRGNQIALKQGRYTKQAIEEQKNRKQCIRDAENLIEEIDL